MAIVERLAAAGRTRVPSRYSAARTPSGIGNSIVKPPRSSRADRGDPLARGARCRLADLDRRRRARERTANAACQPDPPVQLVRRVEDHASRQPQARRPQAAERRPISSRGPPALRERRERRARAEQAATADDRARDLAAAGAEQDPDPASGERGRSGPVEQDPSAGLDDIGHRKPRARAGQQETGCPEAAARGGVSAREGRSGRRR